MLRKFIGGTLLLFLFALPTAEAAKEVTKRLVRSEPSETATETATEIATEPRSIFVHLFEWKWEDVAQECETFLGPNGYAAVQVSPATEHIVVPQENYPWWQRYQPVSYKIESRSGTREQFQQMIDRCHAAGVKIYADAVINHMAAFPAGVGSAGSSFTKYSYPGLYEPKDFHTCKQGITSYQDRYAVTQCELVGLSDLDTGSETVRDRITNYLIDLTNLGIDGFRIDAAKHIDAQELGAILQQVNSAVEPDPYVYQEVIDPGNEVIKKTEYLPNGRVSEFEYGRIVSAKFMGLEGQTLSQLQSLDEWGLMPSEKAIVFIDNHDKQRGHGGGGTYLTHKDGRLYELANLFMLAHPYGTPQVMSSYTFEHSDQGPPADANGNTRSVYQNGTANCFAEWVCEHRWQPIAAMVQFRNAMRTDAPLSHWWSNGRNQIAFGRGDRGFIVLNREDTPLTQTLQTGLPPGRYCNVLDGGSCADGAIEVDDQGQAAFTVSSMSAVAIRQGITP